MERLPVVLRREVMLFFVEVDKDAIDVLSDVETEPSCVFVEAIEEDNNATEEDME